MNHFRINVTLKSFFVFLSATFCCHVIAQTPTDNLRLPSIFSDNMVLQREMPIPFWGICAPGQPVSVSMGNQTEYAVTDKDGKWLIRLSPVNAGGPYSITITAKDTIVLKNVFVGDVWVASGQSNMEMPIAPNPYFTGIKDYEEEVANTNDTLLRIFTVGKNSVVTGPQTQMSGQWRESNPENAGAFTAVGYFFGKNLRPALDIPIGIIHTSWGASPAQAWTSNDVLSGDPEFRQLIDDWKKIDEKYQLRVAEFKKDSASRAIKIQQGDTTLLNNMPKAPGYPILLQKRPSSLYNGMIYPLIPYAIKGVVWYQGEGNESNPKLYEKLFPAMITNWRNDWGQGDFPFLFVQVAGYKKRQTEPVEKGSWAELREAQAKALELPHTGMITAVDIGEEKDVHPKNKQEVGYRLAQCALAEVYKRKAYYSGPVYEKMEIKGNEIQLYFKNTDGGLMVLNSDTLKGFAIAGQNEKFVWGDASIQGNKVIVHSKNIAEPVAVRYDWAYNPIGNLYNGKGLTAMPFRTDNWGAADTDDAKLTKAGTVHILTLGDSNGSFSYGWPYQLLAEIPGSDLFNISKAGKTIGFNNNGDSTLNQLATLDEDLKKANQHIGTDKYDYIIIGLGTNDAKYDFRDQQENVYANLELLIKSIRACEYPSVKSAKIVVKSPTPYGTKSQSQTKYTGGNERVKEMNVRFKQIAEESDCIFIDTFTPLYNDMEVFSNDGLHLDAEGQKKVATLILTGINSTLTN